MVKGTTWSYTPATPLADGRYIVTATQTAPGNAPSAASAPDTFTLDTTAPTITGLSDSGPGITNGNGNGNGDLGTGKTVTFTVTTSEPVYVQGGTPTLTLNDGGTATYVSGSGTGTLVFSHTVMPGQNTPDLTVTGVNPNGATVQDAAGNDADLTGAIGNPPGTLQIDTTAPTITELSDSGPGITNGNGDLGTGKTVTFTVTTSEPVYVQGGTPTLTLNDGGTATYVSGSGTGTLVFSHTVMPGQNTPDLTVTGVNPNGATVQDAAGNDADLTGAIGNPPGTLQIDTTAPVVFSPTDTVAQNSGPTPIGIAAPSDNLTAASNLAIAAGALPTDGTVTLADGATPVVSGQALTVAQLAGLLFTPTPGVSSQGSTFTYMVTDGAGNASQGTAALNVGAPGAPTITGTHASATKAEASVVPFAGVTVTDPSSAAGATETLTIALTGGGGTLSDGSGYTGPRTLSGGNGTYQLTGTAAQVTQELGALSFTPATGRPGATTNTTFVLTDRSTAGTSVVDSGTSIADTAAAAPPPPPGQPTPDTVSLSPLVSYKDGVFTLTGTASSAAGVRSVEITALVDGVATDLGAATVDANGTFTFADAIDAHTQGFITATETDNAGSTAAAQTSYSLTGGLSGGKGRQDRYTADGSAEAATDVFKADGSQKAKVLQPGQTFTSAFFDTFSNNGVPDTTFVFNPGFGRDTIDLFRVDGADHDTLSFKGSDYGNSIATVLNNCRDTAAGLLLTDPTASTPGGGPGTHDTLLLKGITKDQLAANRAVIGFHA